MKRFTKNRSKIRVLQLLAKSGTINWRKAWNAPLRRRIFFNQRDWLMEREDFKYLTDGRFL